jgi:cyclopropane fatty-acyl-phospholipid synthase-like methyltransferase
MSAAFEDSGYDDSGVIANAVADGRHREVIGGLWEQLGNLQFEFLASHGLKPTHHLLDIGCGSLRGGVRFAAYLEPGHYWGVDSNQSLLDAGYTIELAQAGLSDRVPRENLLCDDEFRFARFGRMFDVAIAQSLFTHLSANRIKLCLDRLATVMKPGGRLFATYFEVTDDHPFGEAYDHPHGVRTWGLKIRFITRFRRSSGCSTDSRGG